MIITLHCVLLIFVEKANFSCLVVSMQVMVHVCLLEGKLFCFLLPFFLVDILVLVRKWIDLVRFIFG